MDSMEKLESFGELPDDEIDGHGDISLGLSGIGLRLSNKSISNTRNGSLKDPIRQNIHRAILQGGGTIPLLKTMQTSVCENNCNYCAFRAGRDFRRVTFSPDEMALTFLALQRAGVVKGLFLSSGVTAGGNTSQDRILATAEILRKRHHYQGYLHVKLMPGSQKAHLEQAVMLSDRVSINLESPNATCLSKLAPEKEFDKQLYKPFRWMAEMHKELDPHKAWRGHWPSMTTQFVVGAVGESDLDLLNTTQNLMKTCYVSRAYFSSFKPVKGTPMENIPRPDPWREVRLYQASYLLKDYGYDLEELTFGKDLNLPLECDPKLTWAVEHLTGYPVDLNTAEKYELLRVPGIGPLGAARLLHDRASGHRLNEPGQLGLLGIRVARALPYILINGRRPDRQPALF